MICIGKYWYYDQDNPRFTVPGLLFRVLLFWICCSVFYHSGFNVPYSAVPRSAFRVLPQPGTPGHGITEHGTPAEQRNTPEQWQNNYTLPGRPVEHHGTTEPYKTKNNCRIFKRKFKTQNLNFQLRRENFLLLI